MWNWIELTHLIRTAFHVNSELKGVRRGRSHFFLVKYQVRSTGDRVRVSQLAGVWLKRVHRSAGHHCCGECAASLCGFPAASVSAVCFQFCKLLLHLLSLAPPPSSKLTLLGVAPHPHPHLTSPHPTSPPETLSSFTLQKMSLRLHCPAPPRFFISSLDSQILGVRQQQGSSLILGGGF